MQIINKQSIKDVAIILLTELIEDLIKALLAWLLWNSVVANVVKMPNLSYLKIFAIMWFLSIMIPIVNIDKYFDRKR